MNLLSNCVFIAHSDAPAYEKLIGAAPPELSDEAINTTALQLLRTLLKDAGLDSANFGSPKWNPFGDLINPGDKVLLKPNLVRNSNCMPGVTMECLVTHTSVIEAVLHYIVKCRPGTIIVGDAPIQSCDFNRLRAENNLDEIIARFRRFGYDVDLRDFRMTLMTKSVFSKQFSSSRSINQNCLFDLGENSWLTFVSTENSQFRVTNYNPHVIELNQHVGIHRYLVAREVMDADVVINLPKLKTHKMTGITGALKNMVGISCSKEYLPHHRKGGADRGGDCYQKGGRMKIFAEDSLDRANLTANLFLRYFHYNLAGLSNRLDNLFFGNDRNLVGAWYGNDTAWRMCLDLQRILHYGRADGNIAATPQRRVITITDAIVAGDGNGPLTPNAVPLGIMSFGLNVAAIEWVHCLLMRLNPNTIPLVKHSFEKNNWPLISFEPENIVIDVNGKLCTDKDMLLKYSKVFIPPDGWIGHCEL